MKSNEKLCIQDLIIYRLSTNAIFKGVKMDTERKIKPGDKNKGRENPIISILLSKEEMEFIENAKNDLILYPNGTFEVVEGQH